MQPGEIVISTAGRDSGRYFAVVSLVNEKYVKIADGELRKLDDPKLKNKKHLRSTGFVDSELSIWLTAGKRLRNEDIRSVIKDYKNQEEAG